MRVLVLEGEIIDSCLDPERNPKRGQNEVRKDFQPSLMELVSFSGRHVLHDDVSLE